MRGPPYGGELRGGVADTPLIEERAQEGRPAVAHQRPDGLDGAGREEDLLDAPSETPLLLQWMRLRAAQGDHRRALADWHEAVRRAERLRGVGPAWIEDLVVAADVHRALGDQDGADAVVARAQALAARWGTPGAIGQALHAAARYGSGDDAREKLHQAVEHLRRSPTRVELARALFTLGSALRRQGRRIDSREPLREGYELALACGASALAETARAELRASGIRVQRELLTGADALTASERRIAELAAAGASNAAIAQELFLTVKTVEMHLTSAYRKLDLRSRRDLPTALAGSGTHPPHSGPLTH